MSKCIKIESWTVKQLLHKINNREINKPKYQRKKKWDVMPKNDTTNKPNEKNFIEFLYETLHSVHPITFGKNKDSAYTNIDGNNRINALCHFVNRPFDIFPEYLKELNEFINKNFLDNNVQNEIKTIFREITYTDIMNFKYKNYFNDNNHNELYKNYLQAIRDECEFYIETIQTKLKTTSGDNFDNTISINVNIFEGYNNDELCKTFEKINKYNTKLTDIELLASILCNINNFTIDNEITIVILKDVLKQYYKEKSDNESLECYQFNMTDKINAFDFIVALQKYSRTKCDLIEDVDNDGLSLFFKIYKNLYGGCDAKHFTQVNVNDFIDKINKALLSLVKINNSIFTNIFTGKAFIECKKTISKLVRNNMYLIMCAIIGYNIRNVSEDEIIKSIVKCLLYHFIIKEIKDKDKKIEASLIDKLTYRAGGAYIDNEAKILYDNPSFISDKITQDEMSKIIKLLIVENNIISNSDECKRIHLKLYEKTLMYYYYKRKIPLEINNNQFSIEHICPFSSKYKNLNINRLGNIIPIIGLLNQKRGNKHISVYEKYDTDNTLQCLKKIIPSNEQYNQIINHDNTLPQIINNNKYNDMCDKNENEYIKNFIKYFY